MPNRKESIPIALQYPFPEDRVFRYQAMQDVLDVLIDQPYATYSMSELANLTGANQGTISKAVKLLSELDVIETVQDGRTQQVRSTASGSRNRTGSLYPAGRVPPTSPSISATTSGRIGRVNRSRPVRKRRTREADRASDIDLLVIVDEDRTAARRTVQSVVSDLEDQRFEGNRYTYQPLVESTDSVQRIGDQLRPQFDDGITLVGSGPTLRAPDRGVRR